MHSKKADVSAQLNEDEYDESYNYYSEASYSRYNYLLAEQMVPTSDVSWKGMVSRS